MSMNSVNGVSSANSSAEIKKLSAEQVALENEISTAEAALKDAKIDENEMQNVDENAKSSQMSDTKKVVHACGVGGVSTGGVLAILGGIAFGPIGALVCGIIGVAAGAIAGGIIANQDNIIEDLEAEVSELEEEKAQIEEEKAQIEEEKAQIEEEAAQAEKKREEEDAQKSNITYTAQKGDSPWSIWKHYRKEGVNVGEFNIWYQDFLALNNTDNVCIGKKYKIPSYEQ